MDGCAFIIVFKLYSRFVQLEVFDAPPTVDDFVAVESLHVQQISKASPHLLETEAIENKGFRQSSGIRLGRRGSGVQSPAPTNEISLRTEKRLLLEGK